MEFNHKIVEKEDEHPHADEYKALVKRMEELVTIIRLQSEIFIMTQQSYINSKDDIGTTSKDNSIEIF